MRQADQNCKACERPRAQYPRRHLYFLLWLRISREALTNFHGLPRLPAAPRFFNLFDSYLLPWNGIGLFPSMFAGVGLGGATGRAAGLARAAFVCSGSLSACCNSCDTCQICVGVSMSLKPGMPVRRIPFSTFQ